MNLAHATIDIVRLDAEGDGVGEVGGRPVHVPGTMPGERVEARVGGKRDGHLPGELVRILVASPHRVTPRCRHVGACGGCAWQHIAYPEQLRLKQERLQSLLDESLGARGPRVAPTLATPSGSSGFGGQASGANESTTVAASVPSEAAGCGRDPAAAPWGYRDKVHFVFGPGARGAALVMGHYRRGSRSVIPVEECPVHAEAGNRVAFAVRDALVRARVPASTEDGSDGVARHVVVRVAEGSGELLITLVATENARALRRVTEEVRACLSAGGSAAATAPRAGFHLNIHDRPGSLLFGRETRRLFGVSDVRERVGGVSYAISPTAFFQTNVRAAEVLVRQVLDALGDTRYRNVLDLYSGVGLFAVPLARQGRLVTGVEENREAIASAAAALRLNRVPDRACRLMASRVEHAMDRLAGGRRAPDRPAASIRGAANRSRVLSVGASPRARPGAATGGRP